MSKVPGEEDGEARQRRAVSNKYFPRRVYRIFRACNPPSSDYAINVRLFHCRSANDMASNGFVIINNDYVRP